MLTCAIGRNLGTDAANLDHFELRDLAASLLGLLCKKYTRSSHNLKPRLARSCLKNFLDPNKPFGTHYGAILGLHAIGGSEVIRALVVPNLKEYESLVKEEISSNGSRKAEAEKVLYAISRVLSSLVGETPAAMNVETNGTDSNQREALVEKVGEIVGNRIADLDSPEMARAVLA